MSGGLYGRGKAPERECLKLPFWPAEDGRRWELALKPGDYFDDTKGARVNHSTKSNEKAEKGYGRFLTFLHHHDRDALTLPPEFRITKERVKAYVSHLQEIGNSTQTLLGRLQELLEVAKVMDPEKDWSFINDRSSRVRAQHRPVRDKKDIKLTDELLSLGLKLMAKAIEFEGLEAAILFRDGLIIAFLALVPVRRRNLADLILTENLVAIDGGWLVLFDETETKTHEPHEAMLPDILHIPLQTYLTVHRPYLLAREGRWTSDPRNAVWISKDSSAMTQMAIYDRVRARTKDEFGKPISIHAFRYAAATTLAIADPVHVRIAAPLLGHRTFSTTETYYQQAQTLEAHREYVATIYKRRTGS
ncbi:MAG: site-specific integrase [Beijerinckiaceae bacterium]|nr:site-specific integrase [Beijerinckiaceae bacterium]